MKEGMAAYRPLRTHVSYRITYYMVRMNSRRLVKVLLGFHMFKEGKLDLRQAGPRQRVRYEPPPAHLDYLRIRRAVS